MPDLFTPFLSLTKIEVGASRDTWGNKLNDNADKIDAGVQTLDSRVDALETQMASVLTRLGVVEGWFPPGVVVGWHGLLADCPAGWKVCDGVDGRPDMRDKFLVGTGPSHGHQSTGGAASRTVQSTLNGQHAHAGQTKDTVLSVGQMPSHSHAAWTDEQGYHTHGVDAGNSVDSPGAGGALSGVSGGYRLRGISLAAGGQHAHNVGVGNQGGGGAHNHGLWDDGNHQHDITVATEPPWYAVYFMIRVAA